jgi:hypothetical protein
MAAAAPCSFRRDWASMPEFELWDDLRLVKAIRDAYFVEWRGKNSVPSIIQPFFGAWWRSKIRLLRLFERGRLFVHPADAEMALADRMPADITEFGRESPPPAGSGVPPT